MAHKLLPTAKRKIILFVILIIGVVLTILSSTFDLHKAGRLNFPLYRLYLQSSNSGSSNVLNCEQLKDMELFLRMYSARKPLYENVFVKSLSIFWLCKKQLKLVVVLDNETKADHEFGEEIKKRFPYPRVMYEDPNNNLYHGNGHIRQQLSMFYAEKYTNATYVGFVDTDTLFVTLVTPGILFENGKPSVIGRIGLDGPYWEKVSHNTDRWLGHKEVMKGMSYFPVIIKVKHIKELRKWLEKKHNMMFDQLFQMFTAGDRFSQFTYMCQYVWMYHRDEYSFHFEPLPNDKYDYNNVSKAKAPPSYYKENLKPEHRIPKPRCSIHWSYPEPHPSSVAELSEKWMEAFIGEGFCYSVGLHYCPEKCSMHSFNKTQERLYRFEGPTWAWHPLALRSQQKHYKEVHAIVTYLRNNKQGIFNFESIEEACQQWPKGYNFTYPKGKISTRHFAAMG